MSFLLQKIFETIKENFWDAQIFFELNEIHFVVYGKVWVVSLKEKE